MKTRHWVLTTLSLVVAIGAGVVAFNVWFDLYGIFRDSRGRHLRAFGDIRIAKYLLSARYVPENFNGVLIGSSISENWNTARIQAVRVYNESMDYANIAEEKVLLDQTLSRPGIEVAFLILSPVLTGSHEFHGLRPGPREKIAALGSRSLLRAYMNRIFVHYRLQRFDGADDHGTVDVDPAQHQALGTKFGRAILDRSLDVADPVAVAEYWNVIGELRAHHARIVFIVPPMSQSLLEYRRAPLEDYVRFVRARLDPDDQVIDFMSDEFAGLRNDGNYSDGIHIEAKPADLVVSAINRKFNERLQRAR